MPIAGFDPSLTHLGWVIIDEHKTGKSALLDHGTFITDTSDGIMVQRLILQRERVYALLKKWDIKFVATEAPYWDDYSTEILYALSQFLHEVYLNLDIFVVYFSPHSLKKLTLPDMDPAEVTKHHMVHEAKTELELHGKVFSEHVSDAYFAGRYGARFYQWHFLRKLKDKDLSEHERKLFCGKHTFKRGSKKGYTEYTGIIHKENEQFFDYQKQKRKTKKIIKEIHNATKKESCKLGNGNKGQKR